MRLQVLYLLLNFNILGEIVTRHERAPENRSLPLYPRLHRFASPVPAYIYSVPSDTSYFARFPAEDFTSPTVTFKWTDDYIVTCIRYTEDVSRMWDPFRFSWAALSRFLFFFISL